jgi:hypothetical protein
LICGGQDSGAITRGALIFPMYQKGYCNSFREV